MPGKPNISQRWPAAVALLTAALVIALGLVVIIGWQGGWPRLLRLNSDFMPMLYNTAVCFLCAGAALFAISLNARRVALPFAAIVTVVGLLALLQHGVARDLGIEDLLFRRQILPGMPTLRRMSLVTSSAFCLSGLALLAMIVFHRRKWGQIVIGLISSGMLALSLMAILGYTAGLRGESGWGEFTRMALHTAMGLVTLGVGLFSIAWREESVITKRSPRWLPFSVGLVAMSATLMLWHALNIREQAEMGREVVANAAAVKNEILPHLDSRIRSLTQMAKRWEFSGQPKREVWEADANSMVMDFPDYAGMAWVDPELRFQWVAPSARNAAAIGMSIAEERRKQALMTARDEREAKFTRPVQLKLDGAPGILASVPIYHQDQFEGFIVAGIRIRNFLDAILRKELAEGYAITLSEGGETIYERPDGPKPSTSEWVVTVPIRIHGLDWNAQVWPGPKLLVEQKSHYTHVVLVLGILGSLLLGLSIHLMQGAIARSQRIAATNREMQREITERRHAEEALQASQALYHSLVEHMPAGIFRKDAGGRFVFVNPWFCQLKGTPAERILGRTAEEIASSEASNPTAMWRLDLATQGRADHQRIMESGEPIELEESYSSPGGQSQHLRVIKSAVFNSNLETIGSQGVLFDITELKLAEATLMETSSLLEVLLQNTTDYIYFKDLDSRFVYFSQSMLKVFRLSRPEELKGMRDFDFFSEEHASTAFKDEQEIIRTGRPLIGKVEKEVLIGGGTSWALSSKMPMRNQDGEIIGTFGISKDITAIKETEAELAVAHQKLLETSRLAGMAEVATSVLHNVGNVLNSVNISCSLLGGKLRNSSIGSVTKIAAMLDNHSDNLIAFFTDDPTGRKLPNFLGKLADRLVQEQEEMLRELQLLGRNIDHIKDIVAMQQNYAKVSGVTETLAVSDLVEDSLRMNDGSLTRHEVRIVREYSEMPQAELEKHKVLQILVNLIRNAKHACHDSGRTEKRITVSVRHEDDRIRISVADNGVGIPSENLTRIFAHGFTTKAEGHGFGLHSGALAAREMGGRLTVHSDGPNTGATFTLELPMKASIEPKPNP
ncbi:MAG: PAS domain-containing protein [Luteolibacter sp.]